MSGRRLIVMGASAGGLEAYRRVLAALPADLKASVVLVQHLSPHSHGTLPDLLAQQSALPCVEAPVDGILAPGTVYVAPPDLHVFVERGRIFCRRGPRENRSRPAIDPLFRSAAASYGADAVGVILTGTLDDGTAGLEAIQQCGGMTVVQCPNDADFSEMPQSALDRQQPDHCVPLRDIATVLSQLVNTSPRSGGQVDQVIRRELEIAKGNPLSFEHTERSGDTVALSCPECGGPMWEMKHPAAPAFRCHTGHAYAPRALAAALSESTESSLWAALRALEERERMLRRLEAQENKQGREKSAARFAEEAELAGEHVAGIRALLTASSKKVVV